MLQQVRRQALLHVPRHHRRARLVARAHAVDRQVRSRAVHGAVRQGVPRSAARQDRRRQAADHRARQDAHRGALRLGRQLQRSAVRQAARAAQRRRHHDHLHRRSRRGAVGPRQDRPRAVAARGAGARAAARFRIRRCSRRRKSVAEGVEIIDLLPTIVDALGGKQPADAQGESLVGLAQGEGAGYPRPAIASQYELAHTMRLGRWKLSVLRLGRGAPVRRRQPTPPSPRSCRRSGRSRSASSPTRWACGWPTRAQWKKSRWGVASNQKAELARDLEATAGAASSK